MNDRMRNGIKAPDRQMALVDREDTKVSESSEMKEVISLTSLDNEAEVLPRLKRPASMSSPTSLPQPASILQISDVDSLQNISGSSDMHPSGHQQMAPPMASILRMSNLERCVEEQAAGSDDQGHSQARVMTPGSDDQGQGSRVRVMTPRSCDQSQDHSHARVKATNSCRGDSVGDPRAAGDGRLELLPPSAFMKKKDGTPLISQNQRPGEQPLISQNQTQGEQRLRHKVIRLTIYKFTHCYN